MDAKKQKSWGGPVAALLIALPIFYVLSVGPYFRYFGYDVWDTYNFEAFDRYKVIYAPLHWMCERSDAAGAVVTEYTGWWVPSDEYIPAYDGGELGLLLCSDREAFLSKDN